MGVWGTDLGWGFWARIWGGGFGHEFLVGVWGTDLGWGFGVRIWGGGLVNHGQFPGPKRPI